ncbi:MAG: hypothetical protein WCJ39_08380 [bacterium]
MYESIDFDKPGRSMHMGMMPAKLTHIMINLGLDYKTKKDPTLPALETSGSTINYKLLTTIYDPFVGS